jgi:hypothetical protein
MFNSKKIKLTKLLDKTYKLSFLLENPALNNNCLDEFALIELLYNVNKDYFVDGILKYNKTDGYVYLLIKPVCKELGFSQRFMYLSFNKSQSQTNKDEILIKCTPISKSNQSMIDPRLVHYLKDESILDTCISEATIYVNKINDNKINIEIIFSLDNSFIIFPLFESFIRIFLTKTFGNLQKCYKEFKMETH